MSVPNASARAFGCAGAERIEAHDGGVERCAGCIPTAWSAQCSAVQCGCALTQRSAVQAARSLHCAATLFSSATTSGRPEGGAGPLSIPLSLSLPFYHGLSATDSRLSVMVCTPPAALCSLIQYASHSVRCCSISTNK
jgi:hypothetical protein